MYTGDANHSPSTSEAITINVLADTTTATLAGSPNPSPQGQPVTFTATLTGNFAPPTGTVTFTELFPPTTVATQIGIANLVPGAGNTSTATLILSTLPVGTDTIVASYAATMDFGGASATTTEVISPVLPTRTTLTSSLNPSTVNQAVTFTATVTLASGAATPVPSGIVTFLDGNITLGTGALNASGVAAFTTSSLTVGSHTITATASGSTVTGPSSVTLTQVVDALPPPGSVNFKITVTPSPVSVGVGNAAVLLVTVTPLNGFTETINLGCSNLPTEAACAFAAGSFASGGGSTQLLLSTMAPHSCGSAQPYFTGSNGGGRFGGWGVTGFALPALAGLVAIFLPGRRRWLRALVALVAVAGALQMSGCSTCTDLGTRPNTYTVQVYGSAAATSEVESQSVTLNVTI
jgi:hypothetical protein